MKKLKIELSILVFVFLFGSVPIQAQFFNKDIMFTSGLYANLSTDNKSVCELYNGLVVSVGAAYESPGSSNYNGVLNVHNASGNIVNSYEYGIVNSDERFVAVIPADNNASNGVLEVIVVGSIQNGADWDIIVTRIDVTTGATICSQRLGTSTDLEFGEGVVSMPTPGLYAILGTAYDGFTPKLFVANVNNLTNSSGIINCSVFWANKYTNTNAGGVNDRIVPKNAVIEFTSGNLALVVTGIYSHYSSTWSSREKDVFTISLSRTGTIYSPIKTYDINNKNDIGVDITAMANGNFALGYTTVSPVGSLTISSYITVLKLNPSFSPVTGNADIYWHTQRTENYGVGIYENATATGFDIQTREGDNTVVPPLTNIGFLQVNNTTGTPVSFREYNNTTKEESCSMYKGASGYFMKGTTANVPEFGYTIIGTDFNGIDVGYNCNQLEPIMTQSVSVNEVAPGTSVTDHGFLTSHSLSPIWKNGTEYNCNGGNVMFRTAAPESELEERDIRINPTYLKGNGLLTVSMNGIESTKINIVVSNTLGQIVFRKEYNVLSGESDFEISANDFASGINFISITNDRGDMLISQKIVKE